MESLSYDIIKKLPKVDLHRHIDGALRTETILDIAKKKNYKLPADNVEELSKYVQVPKNCNSLAEFLSKFETFYPLLTDPDVMERIAYEVSEDAFKDNVKYCELRFAPILQSKGKYSMEEILDAVLSGTARAHKEFGIINPIILCGMRSEKPETTMETVELAIKYRDKYRSRAIVAIDLAGDEEHFSGSPHKEAFDFAYKNGLKITIHAGEAGSVDNIREAVEELHASRIGHGIHIVDDENLYNKFIDRQIPLEMCLTSNVHTSVVSGYESHPFPKCFQDGLKVTINTDDPGISNITLSDEYYVLVKYYNFGIKEIEKVILNGIDAAFTTDERKVILKQEFKNEIEEIIQGK